MNSSPPKSTNPQKLSDAPPPWSAEGMLPRRDWIFSEGRRCFRRFVDDDAKWLSPPGANSQPDGRVYVQMALPYLLGNEMERHLAERLLLSPEVTDRLMRSDRCAFTVEYVSTVLYAAGKFVPAGLRATMVERIGTNLLYYASQDLRHKGVNDNHVTMGTSSLILGGQLTGNKEAVEEGRANLRNFRDTFMRRGFMHETNDCYIPHSLYPIAAVAEWAEDEEIRQLALDCETRIWVDWIGHWHVNLSRKPGPSARDYTNGRLNPLNFCVALWAIFGDRFGQPVYPPSDLFAGELPASRSFQFNGNPNDGTWGIGFLARIAAHPYHLSAKLGELIYEKAYPHIICGTHETATSPESTLRLVRDENGAEKAKPRIIPGVMPFSAREIFTYQYQEKDWAMGTASQRMIGNCGNNNWGVYYRKAAPLEKTKDQGLVFCSFTINEKSTTGAHKFTMDPNDPVARNTEDVEHWFDNGRYAAMQHERTSLLLYRPRIHERHAVTSLATTILFPLCFGNSIERLEMGDRVIENFTGESETLCDLFIQDGPLYIAIRPLMPRYVAIRSETPVTIPADIRVRVEREPFWGSVHFYSYRGPALALEEVDLCRIGGGFLCEVATRDDFPSLAEFKAWFRRGKVLDEQTTFMRQVRYHREGLDLALRWDTWSDNIMYRALNGRTYPMPQFSCTGIKPEDVPWLTGDVSGFDHFDWAERQMVRKQINWPDYPFKLNSAKGWK
jgi:hypothetical protein